MRPTPPAGLPPVTLRMGVGDYVVLRHGYVGDPAVYTIYRPDGSLCGSAVRWPEVEPTVNTDLRNSHGE